MSPNTALLIHIHPASLGTGGFGTVVKAIQRATNDACAVKIITRSGLSDKYLYREIDIMKSIQHVGLKF
jgi:serine/threonine protein kinase